MSQERRATFRCVSPSSQEPAILRAGRKDLSAQVLDESAEGMGIRVLGHAPTLAADDLVALTTASRRVTAQVVYIRDEAEGQRIGLRKLRDQGIGPSENGVACQSSSRLMWMSIAVAATLGMYLGGPWTPVNKFAGGISRQQRSQQRAGALDPAEAAPGDELGAAEVSRDIQLSPAQQDRIRRIVAETALEMASLQESGDGQPSEAWAEGGMQAVYDSWRKIELELTPQQRDQWRLLTTPQAQLPPARQ